MRFALVVLLSVLVAFGASAQPLPTSASTALVADEISYLPKEDVLIATGNVTVFYDGQQITADKIVFDNKSGEITTEGAIRGSIPGDAQLLADEAEIQQGFEEALIYGARLLLADNFQFAAAEARRVEGRYTTLYRAVGSACQICADQPVPLWLIRAERVIRDEEALQVYFRNAAFEVMGVTVAYLPYFRIADPSVDRATGFLNPRYRQSNIYGRGLKVPYYIVTGRASDVTLTPFFTSSGASILEGEYRQRFSNGGFEVSGSVAVDDGEGERFSRGHLFLEGGFALGNGFKLDLDLARTFDNSYLGSFGYSDTDRLESTISVNRQRGNSYFNATAIGFQSLRSAEDNAILPNVLPEVTYRAYRDDPVLGRGEVSADVASLFRRDGRDVLEAGLGASWRKRGILPMGVVGQVFGTVDGRSYLSRDDAAIPTDPQSVLTSTAGVTLRWPMVRRSAAATEVIEPVAQVIYSERVGDIANIPNEDSAAMEFDAANLFALNRFPGDDQTEDGWRLNLGANYTRTAKNGWQVGVTLGQVLRPEPTTGFPENTGLNGISSNLVAATNLDLPPYFKLSNQTLFDRELSFSRNDIQAKLTLGEFKLTGNYVYLAKDPSAFSFTTRNEFRLKSEFALADNWDMTLGWQRNLATGRNVRGTLGLEYANECVTGSLSASRRFTSSSNLPSAIEYQFTLELAGLGGRPKDQARRCVRF